MADLPPRAILKLGQRLDCEFVLRLVACPEHFAQALWLIELELDGARLTPAGPSDRPALARPHLLPALTGHGPACNPRRTREFGQPTAVYAASNLQKS